MELCNSNILKFLIFQETKLAYIQEWGNPKNLLILEEITFRARKI